MPIARHYKADFDRIYDELFQTGLVKVPAWKLYMAFEKERLTKSVWRDIRDDIIERFEESRETIDRCLKVVTPTSKDYYLFIYSDEDCPIFEISHLAEGE